MRKIRSKNIITILWSLALEIKYNVLNEKYSFDLWEEIIYMSKSLTKRSYLKKQLFELKMDEKIDVSDHINKFCKCIT